MTRGTTPSYIITVEDFDSLEGHSLYVTLEQGCTELTFSGDDVGVENNVLTVALTQEQSLLFRQGRAKLQVRGLTQDGEAWASEIVTVDVYPILKDGVIT